MVGNSPHWPKNTVPKNSGRRILKMRQKKCSLPQQGEVVGDVQLLLFEFQNELGGTGRTNGYTAVRVEIGGFGKGVGEYSLEGGERAAEQADAGPVKNNARPAPRRGDGGGARGVERGGPHDATVVRWLEGKALPRIDGRAERAKTTCRYAGVPTLHHTQKTRL